MFVSMTTCSQLRSIDLRVQFFKIVYRLHTRGRTWNLVCRGSFACSFISRSQTDFLGTFINPQFCLGPVPLSCLYFLQTNLSLQIIIEASSHSCCKIILELFEFFSPTLEFSIHGRIMNKRFEKNPIAESLISSY